MKKGVEDCLEARKAVRDGRRTRRVMTFCGTALSFSPQLHFKVRGLPCWALPEHPGGLLS